MPQSALALDDFVLEKVAFETRHRSAYLLWDKAGVIWTKAAKRWPKLDPKPSHIEPAKITFRFGTDLEASVEIGSALAIGHYPNLKEFGEFTEEFVRLVTHELQVEDYSRVGLRFTYFLLFKTKESAAAALLNSGLLRLPAGKHFSIDGKVTFPKAAFRWEGESLGALVRLEAEGRKLDFDPPMGVKELPSVHEEKFGIVLDIDYYTIASTGVGQLHIGEWISQVSHLVRRDSKAFLGES
jgi:hypothetical protein